MAYFQEKIQMTVSVKSIIISLCVLLLVLTGYSQIGSDSVFVNYYSSGKKQQEIAFFRKKMLYKKNFYENGRLQEDWYYGYKKGNLKEYRSFSEDNNKKIKIDYWNNGNPCEELHKDSTDIILKDKIYNRRGKLKEVSTLIDKDQHIFLVQAYNRHGRIKKIYYTYPKGTSPVLLN